MLTELRLTNFKAFGETQRIPIKPLTLIFGANSSGKSSIIQSLLLAHHGMETGDFDVYQPRLAGDMVDLGGFDNFVHRHDAAKAVRLHLVADIDRERVQERLGELTDRTNAPVNFSRFGMSVVMSRHSGPEAAGETQEEDASLRPMVSGIEVFFDGQPVVTLSASLLTWIIGEYEAEFAAASHGSLQALLAGSAGARLTAESDLGMLGKAPANEGVKWPFSFERFVLRAAGGVPYPRAANPTEATTCWDEQALRHYVSCLMTACSATLAETLKSITYLGPLRYVPPRHTTEQGIQSPRQRAGGSLAWDAACRSQDVVDDLNRWLGPESFGTQYRLIRRRLFSEGRLGEAMETEDDPFVRLQNMKPDLVELLFQDAQSGIVLSHRDIGFGVSQMIPLVVYACAMRRQLIAVEQPESQLHPAHQAELGDVFIESALGERKNRFLLETHSEHLILRILRRIRETAKGTQPKDLPPIRPSDVAVLYVEPSERGSIVREMEVNERGEFVKAWPGGFFEEGLRETLA